ncbi:MAG: hypothetical protein OEV35_06470 [Gallionellaceae bacterium]|nr:hypothetical protein [Gallionellaceae bacterium]
MFGLFGKKSNHPLADIKSAQQLLDELPKNDALKALQELTSWIEAVREHAEFQLDHEAAVLCLIDDTARPLERKLVRDYFAASALPPFQENRIWMALDGFHTQLSDAYLKVLVRYRNGDKGSTAIKPVLPLISARGIHTLAGKLKCAAARYTLVDQTIWNGLAAFYSHAHEQHYQDETVQLYSGAPASTSIRHEIAGILAWYASSSSTLNRFHLHLAERLTAYLGQYLAADLQRGPDCIYGFDLSDPAPPMRVNMDTRQQPNMLYIGVAGIKPRIEQLRQILKKNIVPEELNLGGLFDAGIVLEVLDHLAKNLTFPPPMRRAVRHKLKVSLNIANGFSSIMEHSGISLNFGDDSSITWEVEDISTGGFRCIVSAPNPAALAIGSLIGLRPEKLDYWGVGIVRRLSRDQQDNLHAGVEILSHRITGVGICEQKSEIGQHALWLTSPEDSKKEICLLMSPDTFSIHRSLYARHDNKSYLLLPLALLEKGEDFDLARYRKIEEDTNPK